jgi:hypothetical protein
VGWEAYLEQEDGERDTSNDAELADRNPAGVREGCRGQVTQGPTQKASQGSPSQEEADQEASGRVGHADGLQVEGEEDQCVPRQCSNNTLY